MNNKKAKQDSSHQKVLQYRENYLCLKSAFESLQSSYAKLKSEHNGHLHRTQTEKAKYVQEINELKKAISDVNVRSNRIRDEGLEMLKNQIYQDVRHEFECKIEQERSVAFEAQRGLECARQEINKLKLQVEQERSDAKGIIEQNRILYESEVTNLRRLKDELSDRLNLITGGDYAQIKDVSTENAQLGAKCSFLSNELDELKQKTDVERQHLMEENRNLRKRSSELSFENKEISSERDSLRNQLRVVRSELEQMQSELSAERQKAFTAVRASAESQSRLNLFTDGMRKELIELRAEAQQQRVEIEAQRDELLHKCQSLEQELELMSKKCQHLEWTASNSALEAADRECKIRDQLNGQIASLEAQLTELHVKVTTVDQGRQPNIANKSENPADHEMQKQINELCERLTRAEKRSAERLDGLLRLVREKQSDEVPSDVQTDKLFYSTLLKFKDEKHELETQLQSVRNNLQRYMENASKKKRELRQIIDSQKEQLKSFEIELAELRKENEALRDNVPLEEYNRVRNIFKDLQKKHDTYEEIILGPLPLLHGTANPTGNTSARSGTKEDGCDNFFQITAEQIAPIER